MEIEGRLVFDVFMGTISCAPRYYPTGPIARVFFSVHSPFFSLIYKNNWRPKADKINTSFPAYVRQRRRFSK
jgi:hypothetical protein